MGAIPIASRAARKDEEFIHRRFDAKYEVDLETGCWVWQGTLDPSGYGTFWAVGKNRPAHRVSYERHVSEIPDGLFLDHKCFRRSCVNPEHLRLATNKQNSENRDGLDPRNTSGFRGVVFDKRRQKWRAAVTHFDREHWIGFFNTAEEAGEAARLKRLELFTHIQEES